jgi:peptidoglycan/LPS O-acetylase OafA/YrhL
VKRTPVFGIDLIRFLAATAVVMWHFAGKPFLTPSTSTLAALLPGLQPGLPTGVHFTWFGWVGVQIFFVISGAVIAYSAEGATARSFFIGRVARLWPAMFLCATLCSILSLTFWPVSGVEQLIRYGNSLIFAPLGPWFSGQVWTLPVEIVFYAFVWLLIVIGRVAWLELFAWLLACVSLSYWLLVQVAGIALPGARYFELLLVLHGGYFAIGIILAKGTTERFTTSRLALVCIGTITAMLEISGRAAVELHGAVFAFEPIAPFAVWCAMTAAIWISMQWREPIAARCQPAKGVFRSLGLLTYPLYLVHYQTGGPIFAALYQAGIPLWLAFLVAYAVAIAFAFYIAKSLEPVLRRLVQTGLDRLLTRPASAAP